MNTERPVVVVDRIDRVVYEDNRRIFIEHALPVVETHLPARFKRNIREINDALIHILLDAFLEIRGVVTDQPVSVDALFDPTSNTNVARRFRKGLSLAMMFWGFSFPVDILIGKILPSLHRSITLAVAFAPDGIDFFAGGRIEAPQGNGLVLAR